jgi:ATP/maltotriose-dependent transcriptional regulator MalT
LRGDHARAEDAYRRASRNGYLPEPGLALMRLAQGRSEAAAAAITRALDEARDRPLRSRLLPAYVEIMLASGEVEPAQSAVDELARLAAEHDVPYLRACATMAQGAILLAREQHREALSALREACAAWQELAAPYEVARTRELLAKACHALGDPEHSGLELDAAAWAYRQLGAAPDLARVSTPPARTELPGGLTSREVEVLRLIAAGKTNRAIADELVLSEKTVARHVSNIFTKLRVPSRAAATAYAYEHALVST